MDEELYSPCDSPGDIDGLLLRLLEVFDLDYCSADFLETPDGQLFFLDLNVSGAWWWIDRLYGGAIRDALADYIEEGVSYTQ